MSEMWMATTRRRPEVSYIHARDAVETAVAAAALVDMEGTGASGEAAGSVGVATLEVEAAGLLQAGEAMV